jgi:hypothetical protein
VFPIFETLKPLFSTKVKPIFVKDVFPVFGTPKPHFSIKVEPLCIQAMGGGGILLPIRDLA